MSKVQESERFVQGLRQQFSQAQTEITEQLKSLTDNRIEIHKEVNQMLLGVSFIFNVYLKECS